MAWVHKAAAAGGSAYAALPDDPGQAEALKIAFVAATTKALQNPEFSFSRLADLLGENDYPLDIIIEHFPFDVFEPLYPDALRAVERQLVDAGMNANERHGWPFDDRDLNVIFWTRNNAARLITSLTESQRHSFNKLLLRATLDRNSVDQIAAQLRQIVGLHPQWAQAVTNYYFRMVTDGMEPALARRRADIYRDKLLDSRAWMIARTELMTAQNMGQRIAWEQAIDLGNLTPDALMQWQAAMGHPNPPCDPCRLLNGTTTPVLGGMFEVGIPRRDGPGQRLYRAEVPPMHPRCRCRMVLIRPRKRAYGSPAPYPDIPQLPVRKQFTVSRRTSAPGRRRPLSGR